MNILQYSIRQTTIEQIFNNFAAEKPETVEVKHAAIDVKRLDQEALPKSE